MGTSGLLKMLVDMLSVVGIQTIPNCEKKYTGVQEEFIKGSEEFKEVKHILQDHGESLSGLDSKVDILIELYKK